MPRRIHLSNSIWVGNEVPAVDGWTVNLAALDVLNDHLVLP